MRFEYDYGQPLVAMVSRAALDALLVERARQAGALFIPQSPVRHLSLHPQHVEVGTADGRRYAARYLVGADGVLSTVARMADLAEGKRLALALEWELVPADGLGRWRGAMALDSAAVPFGYGWVFPKRDHLSVGVGGLTRDVASMRAALEAMLRNHGISGAAREKRAYWLSSGGRPLTVQRRRVLLVGDAAGFVDPFLGEGICYAAWSGRLAADAVAEALRAGREPAYQERVAETIVPDLRRAERLLHWFYRWHVPLVAALSRWPGLMRPLLDVVAGRISYGDLPEAAREAARGARWRRVVPGGTAGPSA